MLVPLALGTGVFVHLILRLVITKCMRHSGETVKWASEYSASRGSLLWDPNEMRLNSNQHTMAGLLPCLWDSWCWAGGREVVM